MADTQELLLRLSEWETTQTTLAKYASSFPTWIVNAKNSPVEFYLRTDPLVIGILITSFLAFVCWTLSVITKNYSQVDRLWSLIPPFYSWHYTLHDFANNQTESPNRIYGLHPRLLLISILTTIWGARLTYNFWRKGGYKWSDEDYRWPYIRARIPGWAFQLLNAVFIAPYQNFLLLALTNPIYVVYLTRDINPDVKVMDGFISVILLMLIVVETVSDQQQWKFQNEKKRLIKEGLPLTGDYAKGFLTREGLWRFSRHPNFFSEISIWWAVYFFSVSATAADSEGYNGVWRNWTMMGPILLSLLFLGSTTLTEKITLEKYPAYKDYQYCVSMIIPWATDKLPKKKEEKLEIEAKKDK